MANVLFKRGLHSALPTGNNIVDGAFYLTKDTGRLFVGQDDNGTKKLVELNKSITTVATIADLPKRGVEVGQFYYVTGPNAGASNTQNGNILAVVVSGGIDTDAQWVQVNPDTNTDTGYNYNSSLTVGTNGQGTVDTTNNRIAYTITLSSTHKNPGGGTTAASEGDVTATFYVNSSDINSITQNVAVAVGSSVVSGNSTTINTSGNGSSGSGFTITGGDNVTLTGDTANAVTISAKDTTYTLGSAANSTAVTLTPSTGAATSVNFAAGTNMSVSGTTAGTITYSHDTVTRTDPTATTATASEGTTITVVDGVTTDAQGHVTAVATKTVTAKDTTYTADSISADSSGNLSFGIKASPSNATSTKVAEGVLYNSITVDGTTSTVYNQGNLGSFYSADKVDELIAGLNAMTYKGTVGGTGATVASLPTTNVELGDTYMVGEADAGVQGSRPGDLLIATGTEDNDGHITAATLSWALVPAGSDPDTTYTFSVANDGTISATPSTNSSSHVTIAQIVGSNPITTSVSGSTITINHANSGVTAGTKGDNSSITAALGYSGTFVVPKVTVDAKGHVTAIDEQTLTLPASDNTTYSISAVQNSDSNKANIRLTPSSGSATNAVVVGDGTAISAAVVSGELKISHDNKFTGTIASGNTTATFGPSANVTKANSDSSATFSVPEISVDQQGHVTLVTDRTIVLNDKDTTYSWSGAHLDTSATQSGDGVKAVISLAPSTGGASLTTDFSAVSTGDSVQITAGSNGAINFEIVWQEGF